MKPSQVFFGVALIVLGVLLLLDRFTGISFGSWWPLLLILFGLWLVITRGRFGYSAEGGQEEAPVQGPDQGAAAEAAPSTEPAPGAQPAGTAGAQAAGPGADTSAPQAASASRALDFERTVAFSEMHERFVSTLRRGKATAVFGSGVVDLTHAVIPAEGASVGVVAVFGSMRVYAPASCTVTLKGTPVLGSYELKPGAANARGTGPELRMEGAAVFGEVEVIQ